MNESDGERMESDANRMSEPQPQQAAPAPQPVGLTWDQFVAACEAEYGEDFEPQVVSQATEEEKTQMLRVVRMVERAHGIPAPQATQEKTR